MLLLLRLLVLVVGGPSRPRLRVGGPCIHQERLVQRVVPVRIVAPSPLPPPLPRAAAGVDADAAAVADAVAAAGARGTDAVAPIVQAAFCVWVWWLWVSGVVWGAWV